jgi:DNA-directed RNA polymerase specialized sigma24 family protein
MKNSGPDEYEQFVRARTPALMGSANLLTRDQQLAEDLVQEALARQPKYFEDKVPFVVTFE